MDEPRHLFVDGYNVLYAWQWLRPGRDAGAAFEAARDRLIEAVRTIRDVEGLAVTVVFDGRGSTMATDAGTSGHGVTALFAPAGKTADSVIEHLVASAPDPHACTVATADALERETVSASGGSCVSPEDLQAWCERCRLRVTRAAARRGEQTRASWGNKLPL
ncbi:MAG: NYN domain-containing protein [Opitutaceae bacterium]|nr:NYN domain-containing protein [Opitutaceae bacterium]